MKASALMWELRKLIDIHGDLDVIDEEGLAAEVEFNNDDGEAFVLCCSTLPYRPKATVTP